MPVTFMQFRTNQLSKMSPEYTLQQVMKINGITHILNCSMMNELHKKNKLVHIIRGMEKEPRLCGYLYQCVNSFRVKDGIVGYENSRFL